MSDMENLESSLSNLFQEVELWHEMLDYNAGLLNQLGTRRSGVEPTESMVMLRVDPEVHESNDYGTVALGEHAIYDSGLTDLRHMIGAHSDKLTLYDDGQDEIFVGEWEGQEVQLLVTEWYTPPGSATSSKLTRRLMAFAILSGRALADLDGFEQQRAIKLGISPSAAAGMNMAQLWVYENFSTATRHPEFFRNLPD